jgi:homoserine O-succinyltransferase/O-acetyltransferase
MTAKAESMTHESERRRPLRVALLNLMPNKPATDAQFARLLRATGRPVELVRLVPGTCRPRNTSADYLARHYVRWPEVRNQRFDGLIVTGAPVETLAFEAVDYWRELTEIFDWARSHVRRSYFVCWAAQAALYHRHGVPKHALPDKAFGVFAQNVRAADSAYLRGFADGFPVPVSRHTEVREADLPASVGLRVLAASAETGVCLVEDAAARALYMFNHLEYDAETLDLEYRRDLQAQRPIAMPHNYYPADDPRCAPRDVWRSAAERLFRNWLDLIARDAERTGEAADALGWVLAGRPALSLVGRSDTEFLVTGDRFQDLVPTILGFLGARNLPLHGLVNRPARTGAGVELRLGGLSDSAVEEVARGLAALPGLDWVAYRCARRSGGVFAAHTAHRTGAPMPKTAAGRDRGPAALIA